MATHQKVSCFSLCLILCLSCTALAQQKKTNLEGEAVKARFQERDNAYNLSLKSLEDGKFEEAFHSANLMLVIERELLDEDHEDIGLSISYLGDIAEYRGLWDESENYRRTFHSRMVTRYGRDHWKATDARLALENTKLLKKLLPEQMLELQTSESRLNEYLNALGQDNNQAALEILKGILNVRKKILGEQHPLYATGLMGLAALYSTSGDRSKAVNISNKVLEIRKNTLGINHPDYATSLHELGCLFIELEDYKKAEPLLAQASEIRKIVLGEQHSEYVESLNNLAYLYQKMGNYAKAMTILDQANKTVLEGDDPNSMFSQAGLDVLHMQIGDYSKAARLWAKDEDNSKPDLDTGGDQAKSLKDQAFKCLIDGDLITAERLYIQVMENAKIELHEKHSADMSCYFDLAQVYIAMGNYAKAESLLLEAMDTMKLTLGEKHPDFVKNLYELASRYIAMGDYVKAESLYIQALENKKIALGEYHSSYGTGLQVLADLYCSLGDFSKAEPLYSKALEIKKLVIGEMHPEYATSLHDLANLYDKTENHLKAQTLYEQCLSITRQNLRDTAYVLSERQQLAMKQSVRPMFDDYLKFCLASPIIPPKAVENVLLWKGSVLVRLSGLRTGNDDPAISEQFAKLQLAAALLSKQEQAIPDTKDLDSWKTSLGKLTAEKEELEAELMRSSAAFRQAVEHVSFGQIRDAIPEDAVLIDYLEFSGNDGPSLIASIVKRDGEPVMIPLGSAKHASEAIDVWRETFGMSSQAKAAGLQLRQQIWDPVLIHIGFAKTILVSTDGVLGRLPLAALPGKEAGTYLIEDHRITLIPVPQMLPALVREKGRKNLRRELMLMGDIDYDSMPAQIGDNDIGSIPTRKRPRERSEISESVRGNMRWNTLSETRSEVEFIGGLYKRLYQPSAEAVIDLRRSNASETAFRKHAPECEFIHLATHGFFAAPSVKSALSTEMVARRGKDRDSTIGNSMQDNDREILLGHNPGQLSGIVFAGANRIPSLSDPIGESNQPEQVDDGLMTADEIASLRLEGVRLAVLSACETGLGEVAGGEGLLGIQRSFQIAGVRSTVASLWKVNDSATRRLMQEFYTNYLDKEMSMLDALRETQLWALRNPNEVPRGVKRDSSEPETSLRLPPQYWAPFVLSGDWR